MGDITTTAIQRGREAAAKVRAIADQHPLAQKAKDAVYTAVGAGVITAQRATAAAKSAPTSVTPDQVAASVRKSVADATSAARGQAGWLDAQLSKTAKAVNAAVAPIEQHLPTALREFSVAAREWAAKLRPASTEGAPKDDEA